MNWERVFGVFGRGDCRVANRAAGRSVRSRRLAVEPLEERRLLSASALPSDLDVFALHSLEGASAVLYLDFNGHTTTGTDWNTDYYNGNEIITPAFSFDDDFTEFSIQERTAIYEVWRRVAEDYLPFQIDVTTEEPIGDNCSSASAQRVAIGGKCTDWYAPNGGATGVGYIGTYGRAEDIPCFVFSENCVGNFKIIADVASHESGHTFGLQHDGCTIAPAVEYYPGSNGWGPIMGGPYYQELTQWSCGEYAGAANISNGVIQSGQQDDLALIAEKIASVNQAAGGGTDDGYRTDDYGDTISTAALIPLVDGGGLMSGVIGRTGDVDYFYFTGTGAALDIWVGGNPDVTNLDVLATIYGGDGGVLAEYDPIDTLYCEFTWQTSVGATYYLSVTGTGKTVDSNVYYTNYGSLGAYDIVIGTGSALVVTTESDTIVSDGKLSLREAILLAGGNGVIRFDTALRRKTITLSGEAFRISRSVTIDATALITTNPAGETDWGITMDAGGLSQIFCIQPQYYRFNGETVNPGSASLDVTLAGLELVGGRVELESESVFGGGVYCNGGTLRVESCRFYDNRANRSVSSNYFSGGGAIYTGGNLTICDCVFENNTAANGFGGTILTLGGITTIEGSRFVSNSAEQGGAIVLNGVSAAFTGCVLVENEASKNGGGVIAYASVSFTGCDLSRNRAVRGGGLYVASGVSAAFDLGTIGGNEAKSLDTDQSAYGGGVYNYGTLTVSGSVIAGNVVWGEKEAGATSVNTGFGGGIYSSGTLTLLNVTCAGNFALYYGGGVFNSGTFSVGNSILYGNTAPNASDFYTSGGSTTLDYSLYGSKLGSVSESNVLNNVNAGFTLFTAISAYANWSNTLYQGWNLRLADGSAAIDAGNNDLAADSKMIPLAADLDGTPRIIDGDGDGSSTVDMGAYEYSLIYAVTTQAGCDFYLGGDLEGKTVRFDLDGDGDYDDFSAKGLVCALQFAGYSGEDILAVAVDSDGTVSEPFRFVCTVIPRPSVWFVQSAAFCDNAVLKLAISALADSAVVRWTLDWGDESTWSVFDSVAQTLRTVHYYSTDVSNYSTDVSKTYSVELTAEFADSTTETVTLLRHVIDRPVSLVGIEPAAGFVSERAECACDASDSAALLASNAVLTGANAVLTGSNAVLTGANAVLTGSNAVLTGSNSVFALQMPAAKFSRRDGFSPLTSKLIAPAGPLLTKSRAAAELPLLAATPSDAVLALDALFAGGRGEFFTPSDEDADVSETEALGVWQY